MTSRAWRSVLWFASTLFGGGCLICVERHDFILLLVVAFIGSVTFDTGIDIYYEARLEEEAAEARRRHVAAISGNGDDL